MNATKTTKGREWRMGYRTALLEIRTDRWSPATASAYLAALQAPGDDYSRGFRDAVAGFAAKVAK